EAVFFHAAVGNGPAIVFAGLNEVQLIVAAPAELARRAMLGGQHGAGTGPGKTLHIAVAQAPDAIAEGVAGSRVAIAIDAQDFSRQRAFVLGFGGAQGIAGAYVQVAIGPKFKGAPIVVRSFGNAAEDHLVFG